MAKDITPQLRDHAAQKTTNALDQLERAAVSVEQKLRNASLGQYLIEQGQHVDGKPVLYVGFFLVHFAGLGFNFLNGKLHKQSRKKKITDFVINVNRALATKKATPSEIDNAKIEELEAELEAWKDKYAKLRAHAHEWHHRMHSLRRELRNIKKSFTPRVVKLRDE